MNFTTVSQNGAAEGYCIVKSADKKVTAKGIPYLDLILTDSTGEISAKLWDYKEELQGWITANKLVKIRGTVSEYNGAEQLRVERIRPVTDSDNVRVEDFVPSAYYRGEEMLAEIRNVIAKFQNTELQRLLDSILDEYSERLLYWPAAIKLHHAVRGGLLLHTLSVLRLAQRVSEIYPFVDSELLYAGVILHDVAKVLELDVSELGVAAGHTVCGALLGHLAMGAIIVDRKGRELGIDESLLVLVEHMLLSHHGEPDFGAAVRPMFLEAEILSQLDMLDARIYEFTAAAGGAQEGGFSPKQWALDNRKLYNHGRTDSNPQAHLIENNQ